MLTGLAFRSCEAALMPSLCDLRCSIFQLAIRRGSALAKDAQNRAAMIVKMRIFSLQTQSHPEYAPSLISQAARLTLGKTSH